MPSGALQNRQRGRVLAMVWAGSAWRLRSHPFRYGRWLHARVLHGGARVPDARGAAQLGWCALHAARRACARRWIRLGFAVPLRSSWRHRGSYDLGRARVWQRGAAERASRVLSGHAGKYDGFVLDREGQDVRTGLRASLAAGECNDGKTGPKCALTEASSANLTCRRLLRCVARSRAGARFRQYSLRAEYDCVCRCLGRPGVRAC